MRSGTETAIGGSMLGMSMPLVGFGGVLAIGQAALLGLSDAPLVLPFGALIVLSAMLLASAGSTLLWWKKQRVPRRAVAQLPRARRRELPRPRITAPTPVMMAAKAQRPMGSSTTQLVAFAGTERRVRIVARA